MKENLANDPKIIVALDFNSEHDAYKLIDSIDPQTCRLKVGKEMFTYFGPQFVKNLISRKFDVFLDLKFHDIPITVGRAVAAAADLGVWMVNVHALGGTKMLDAAVKSLDEFGNDKPYLIAVTILTSMDQSQINNVGINDTVENEVKRLAKISFDCGLDGVVCSALEANVIRELTGDKFIRVTPGIRPSFAAVGDQSRIMTPKQALKNGSSYLVIGRPITKAEDPNKAIKLIMDEINN